MQWKKDWIDFTVNNKKNTHVTKMVFIHQQKINERANTYRLWEGSNDSERLKSNTLGGMHPF